MKEFIINTTGNKFRILWLNRWQDAKVFVQDAVEATDIKGKVTYKLEAVNG